MQTSYHIHCETEVHHLIYFHIEFALVHKTTEYLDLHKLLHTSVTYTNLYTVVNFLYIHVLIYKVNSLLNSYPTSGLLICVNPLTLIDCCYLPLSSVHESMLIESFRLPFTLNGNGEKRHKISLDTLTWQCLPWICNVSYIQNHLLQYEISVEFFCMSEGSIQRFVSVQV